MDWFYVENGSQQGPVNEETFHDLQAKGVITPETLVWQAGMPEWLPLSRAQGPNAAITAATAAQHGMAACAECGVLFPQEDMIQFRGAFICATCKPVFFQRLKEGATLPGEMVYAGFWIRWGAVFIDGLIMGALGLLMNAVVSAFVRPEPGEFGFVLMFIGTQTVSLLMGLSYETWFIGKYGATLGKMALGLKVVRPDGESVTYMRALGRFGAKYVSGIILSIGYLMAAFDEEKRALHDRMCDTRVIRNRAV